MAAPNIADRIIETDVLVIGGGIGGCPVACKAAEHGLEVALIEKSKIERSGKAGQGLDEIGIFPRDGFTPLDAVRKNARNLDPNIRYKLVDNALWALEELERLGVNMRYIDGEYGWMPWFGSGAGREVGPKVELRVHWQNVKPEMAAAVRKRGVKVFDRTMVVDLLTHDGKVAGATAVNSRTGEFIIFKAKAVVIATGDFSRHYEPAPPPCWKYKMAYNGPPTSSSGDGQALAYRAGADLSQMERMEPIGIRDLLLMQPGQFYLNDGIVGKVLTAKGEELSGFRGAFQYLEYERKGLIPLFYSLENLPDDFQKRLEIHIADETMLRLKLSEDRGFNPRTHRYQIAGNHGAHHMSGGILIDENFAGSLKGLYAIGDCADGVGGGCGSSTAGLLVGDSIHKYVSEAGEPVVDEAQAENQKQAALAPLAVRDGVEPLELECTIRSLCEEYAGAVKSEGMLREGLRRLGSLRRLFLPRLMAANPHYLMRCLEVRNILDMAEVHLQASLERKETRAVGWGNVYVRLDYPERDPSLDNKRICQRLEKGKAVVEMREVPVLKPEYANKKT
jgi:succinate dehydrogenase/fumarate reductase flavoprotein subunit